MKKVQIGARINVEDAEFINLLEINGAKTPSDKLRAIIEKARKRSEYSSDFSGNFKMVQENVIPIIEKIKKTEFEKGVNSVLLARILEWLPDFYAYIVSSLPENPETKDALAEYEKGAIERVARLFEALLHLELSSQQSSYSAGIFEKHMSHLADLIQIIDKNCQKKEGQDERKNNR